MAPLQWWHPGHAKTKKTLHTCSQKYRGMESYRTHCRRAGTGGDTGRLVAGRSEAAVAPLQWWHPGQRQKKHFTLVLKSTEEWSLTENTAAVAL